MANTWRSRSRAIIYSILLEHEAQAALLNRPINVKACLKAISAAYPFGERKNHPYKQWLAEYGNAKQFLRLANPLPVRLFYWFCEQQKRKPAKPVEGQMTLWSF